jgi:hypothetical protein
LYPDKTQVLHSLPTKNEDFAPSESADFRPQEDGSAVAMGKSASAPAVIALEISALESSAPKPHIVCNRARYALWFTNIPTGEQL